MGMIVTYIALGWTVMMWVAPRYVDVPMPMLTAARSRCSPRRPLKTLLLYPQKVRSGVKGALIASLAGLSLTHTVGKAVWTGLFTSGKPFLRTPKCEDQALLSQALRGVWQETALFSLCMLAIVVGAVDGRVGRSGRVALDHDAGAYRACLTPRPS